MLDTERSATKHRIRIAKIAQDSLLPHLRWELVQVMSRVRPDDLSAAEIAALLDILTPADARVVGGPPGRPWLRVHRVGGKHPASNLA